mmetsp:Transcript_28627/g.91373  ORF Transcript_28627/g.91373 Transcript_28627/m.91373 type:complete len:207 (+) Transcript_28627:4316-4936(+)
MRSAEARKGEGAAAERDGPKVAGRERRIGDEGGAEFGGEQGGQAVLVPLVCLEPLAHLAEGHLVLADDGRRRRHRGWTRAHHRWSRAVRTVARGVQLSTKHRLLVDRGRWTKGEHLEEVPVAAQQREARPCRDYPAGRQGFGDGRRLGCVQARRGDALGCGLWRGHVDSGRRGGVSLDAHGLVLVALRRRQRPLQCSLGPLRVLAA